MKIVIIGKPIAKMRARFSRRGTYVITYDPQKEDKEAVKSLMIAAIRKAFDSDSKSEVMHASELSMSKAFILRFLFFLEVPSSDSNSLRNLKLWGIEPATCKPDYDNLEKFYLDCSSGTLFEDDRLVVEASSAKFYSSRPRVEIEIIAKKRPMMHHKEEAVLKLVSPSQMQEFFADVQALSNVALADVGECEGDLFPQRLHAAVAAMISFSKHGILLRKVHKITDGVLEPLQELHG